ncbi:lectin family integral membrane protein [Anopheles sinensis]|uniref:Lectin family integral membrane protein n=1 Tax=Anopheles sinensis TaxID=74873 RepID=A0A084WD54_ANOSI|nr:lectin family integral membrane protein [Anopheles sinensis]
MQRVKKNIRAKETNQSLGGRFLSDGAACCFAVGERLPVGQDTHPSAAATETPDSVVCIPPTAMGQAGQDAERFDGSLRLGSEGSRGEGG